jgi:DNA-binding transcriptional LysR family regulator
VIEPKTLSRLVYFVAVAEYERAVGALQEAQDAIAETAKTNSRPQGTLRIAAPDVYGTIMVVPAVTKFLADYPEGRCPFSRTAALRHPLFRGSVWRGWEFE